MTASIMAVCIISIYKIARRLGGYISLSALVLCGISALIINFLAIQVNPFLTKTYYYILGTMILFAATGTTCYNKYLLYRHNRPAGQAALHDTSAAVTENLGGMMASPEKAEPAGKPESDESVPGLDTKPEAVNKPDTSVSIEPETASISMPNAEDTAEPAEEQDTPAEQQPVPETAAEIADSESKPASEAAIPQDIEANASHSEAEHIAEAQALPDNETVPSNSESKNVSEMQESPNNEAEPADSKVEAGSEMQTSPDSESKASDSKSDDVSESQALPDSDASSTEPDEETTSEPKPEAKPSIQPKAELLKLPDGLESMDSLLDFAFAQAGEEAYDMALLAYSTALEQYRNDPYAPFIVIDMVNLYKSQERYQEAIDCVTNAMNIPAIQESPAYQHNFQDYLAQLKSICHNADTPQHSSKD